MKSDDSNKEKPIEETQPKLKTFGWVKEGNKIPAMSNYLGKSREEKDGKICLLYELPVEG